MSQIILDPEKKTFRCWSQKFEFGLHSTENNTTLIIRRRSCMRKVLNRKFANQNSIHFALLPNKNLELKAVLKERSYVLFITNNGAAIIQLRAKTSLS